MSDKPWKQYNPTHLQSVACHFLENRGYQFYVHFGVLNAFDKAIEVLKVKTGFKFYSDTYLRCPDHENDLREACPMCEIALEYNRCIDAEIAEKMGWLTNEPAGDVPMERGGV